MNENELHDFGAGDELVDILHQIGVINESFHNEYFTESLTESKKGGTPTTVPFKNVVIQWENFKTNYTNYDKYPDDEDVLNYLGISNNFFRESKNPKDAMRKTLDGFVEHFLSVNSEAREILVPRSQRMKAYSSHFADQRSNDLFKPSIDSIDGGYRGRRTRANRAIEKINSQELMAGEFYSDFTRIPKSNWGSWLRFWERDYASVRQDKSLFGRNWKKTFVLGFQAERNVIYEIWYNSLDSSFTLHDSKGNVMSRKFPTLNEGLKALLNALVQHSSQDSSFFASGVNNAVATSMLRSMAGGLDQHILDLQRLDNKEQEATLRSIADAENKSFEADRKRREARAERARHGVLKALQNDVEGFVDDKMTKINREVDTVKSWGRSVAKVTKPLRNDLKKDFDEVRNTFRGQPTKKPQPHNPPPSSATTNTGTSTVTPASAAKAETPKTAAPRKARKNSAAEFEQMFEQPKKTKTTSKRSTTKKLTESEEMSFSHTDVLVESETAFGFERLVEEYDENENQAYVIDDIVSSTDHMSEIRRLRSEATNRNSQNLIKSLVNTDLVSTYAETRVHQNFPKTVLPRWINKGRREPIVLPIDKPSIWNRAKMFIKGMRYQADFVIGFSLSDRIDIEIWYVTEPNPESRLVDFGAKGDFSKRDTVSSFYVFDVTSGTLIRKYIPYYRNAVQVAMAKISAQ